jgi:hypothetical protein
MKATEIIHLRIDSETLELIRQQAKANYRTIAQQINYTLKVANSSKEGK